MCHSLVGDNLHQKVKSMNFYYDHSKILISEDIISLKNFTIL